jgi:hypothetical protein
LSAIHFPTTPITPFCQIKAAVEEDFTSKQIFVLNFPLGTISLLLTGKAKSFVGNWGISKFSRKR